MIHQILPEFVEEIPKEICEGHLYLCLSYNAVVHKCACGCGEIISTPLDKKHGWIMQYDGETVTLSPSIGNGSYRCRSHYYIRGNRIIWLDKIGEPLSREKQKHHFSFVKLLKNFWKRNLLT